MRKTLISILIIISFLSNTLAEGAFSTASSVSTPYFSKSTSQARDDENTLRAYLLYAISLVRSTRKNIAKLTRKNFETIQAKAKRIAILEFQKNGESSYALICSVNGRKYRAELAITSTGETISITKLPDGPDLSHVRFFPAFAFSIEIPDDVIELAESIIEDRNFSYNPSLLPDLDKLSDAMIAVFKKAFHEGKMFGSAAGIKEFFEGREGVPLADLSINEWGRYENEAAIKAMLLELAAKEPAIKSKLAKLSCAIAMIFYKQRTYGAYSRSAFFYSMAHALVPENTEYHSSWALTLLHCGMTEEANRETDNLLAQYPEMSRVLITKIHLLLKTAASRIRDLERKKPSSLTLAAFMDEESAIRVSIDGALKLSGRFPLYPRALSEAGNAYQLLARLNIFKYHYLLRFPATKKSAAGALNETIHNVGESMRYLRQACDAAEPASGEIEHAQSTFDSVTKRNIHILDRACHAIKRDGLSFPHHLPLLRRSMHKIMDAIHGAEFLSPETESGIDPLIRSMRHWIELQEAIYTFFTQRLRECEERDVRDTEAFFARLKSKIADDIKTQLQDLHTSTGKFTQKMTGDIVDFHRKRLETDSMGIAIIHVHLHELGKKEPTLDNIRELVELIVSNIPPDPEFRRRLMLIARALDLRIVKKVVPEDAVSADKGEERPPLKIVNRGALKFSVDSSERNSAVSRIGRLMKELETIEQWQVHPDIRTDYISGLISSVRNEAATITQYSYETNAYLAGGAGSPSDGLALLRRNRAICQKLDELEAQKKRRYLAVQNIISSRVKILEERMGPYISLQRLGIDWVNNRFMLLRNSLAELRSLATKEGDPAYLSYARFCELESECEGFSGEIDFFGKTLSTFQPILSTIDFALDEANLTEAYFGASNMINIYKQRFNNARKSIFAHALEGRSYDQIPEAERSIYEGIPRRTSCLKGIRQEIQIIQDNFDTRPISSVPVEVARFYDEERARLLLQMKNDVTSPQEGDEGIVWQICDLDRKAPTTDDIERIMTAVANKRNLLNELEGCNIPYYWNAIERKLETMNRAAPGVASAAQIERLREIHRETERDLALVRTMSIFGDRFEKEHKKLYADCTGRIFEYYKTLGDIYSKWHKIGAKEVQILKDVMLAWIDNWLGDMVTAKERKAIEANFDTVLAILNKKEYNEENNKIISNKMKLIGEAMDTIKQRYGRKYAHFWKKLEYERLNMKTIPDLPSRKDPELRHFQSQIKDRKSGSPDFHYISHSAYDYDETMCHEELVIMDSDPSSPIMYRTRLPKNNPDNDEAIEAINTATAAFIREDNESLVSRSEKYAGIRLRNPSCATLIFNCLKFYENALSCWLADDNIMPDIRSMDIKDAVLTNVLDSCHKSHEDNFHDFMEKDRTIALLSEKIALFEDMERRKGALKPPYKEQKRQLKEALKNSIMSHMGIWSCPENANHAVSQFLALINRVSNRNYTIPEKPVTPERFPCLLWELPPARKPAEILSMYPKAPRYDGVYFDTKALAFKVRAEGPLSASPLLASALNKAFSFVIDTMRGKAEATASEKKEKWYGELNGLIKQLQTKGIVDIAVAENLPTNSMVVGNTLVINKDFIECLLQTIDREEPASLILGERLIHDLGLIAYMERPSEYPRANIINDEIMQILMDTVFYARIRTVRPDLIEALEEFTDKEVLDRRDGERKKFSRAFDTTMLYRNMRRWADMIGTDEESKTQKEVKDFATKAVDTIARKLSRYAHLFPNIALSEKPKTERTTPFREQLTLESLFAMHSVKRLEEADIKVADSVDKKNQEFFAKKRKIIISSSLIPDCQKRMAGEINRRSHDAFESGHSSDVIEIRPFEEIQGIASDAQFDIAVLLDKKEAAAYNGHEARLVFSRDGDYPVLINGLIAAGRAVLYKDGERLRKILIELSGMSDNELPSVSEIEELLKVDKEELCRRLPAIRLPPINIATGELNDLNRNILEVIPFA